MLPPQSANCQSTTIGNRWRHPSVCCIIKKLSIACRQFPQLKSFCKLFFNELSQWNNEKTLRIRWNMQSSVYRQNSELFWFPLVVSGPTSPISLTRIVRNGKILIELVIRCVCIHLTLMKNMEKQDLAGTWLGLCMLVPWPQAMCQNHFSSLM